MERQRLIETLEQLRTDLANSGEVDESTRARLQALSDDIDRILDENQPTGPEDVEPVQGGLNDLLRKFEAEYPQLATSIGRVADALAAMGI